MIGAALVAAIVADTKILVTSVNTTGSVALTATNKGTVSNEIPLEVVGAVAGVVVVLTAMASGASTHAFEAVTVLRIRMRMAFHAISLFVVGRRPVAAAVAQG